MDHKKSPIRRQKRTSKVLEDNFWDCSVCTYRNTAEAFKCSMCDVRKGTSTRKPRLNSALAAQQAATLPGASSTAAAAGSGSAAAAPLANGSASNNNNQHNNHSSPHNNHTTTNNHHSHSAAAAAAAHNHSGGNNAGGSSHNSSSHHHHHHPKPPKVSRSKAKHKKYPARLTNVDRSTAQTREVTVNSVTVVITEYKPKVAKQPPSRRESSEQSMSESNDSRS